MEEEHKGFDVNSFIKDNPDSKKMTAEFPLAIPEGNPTPAKKYQVVRKKNHLRLHRLLIQLQRILCHIYKTMYHMM